MRINILIYINYFFFFKLYIILKFLNYIFNIYKKLKMNILKMKEKILTINVINTKELGKILK